VLRNAKIRLGIRLRNGSPARASTPAAWHMTLTPALERYSARVRPLVLAVFGAAAFMLVAAALALRE